MSRHHPFLFAVRLMVNTSYWGNNTVCTHCGQPATKEALFKDSGAIVIEKYCDGCIMNPKKFKEIQRLHRL